MQCKDINIYGDNKIIGFEYICNLYNIKYIEIAEELGISKQTINSWVSGIRRIPDKHLPKLSEKFKLSQEYFKKELSVEDKIAILENEIIRLKGDM